MLMPDKDWTCNQDVVSDVRKSFEFFRDNKVDAVVIPGDLAMFGTVRELQTVADAWKSVFPDDKRPDGEKVERLFVMGNHDSEGWMYDQPPFADRWFKTEAERREGLLAYDLVRNWERVFDEPFSDFSVRTVRGYDFVLAHWRGPLGRRISCAGWREDCLKGVDGFYKTLRGRIDPKRPFFHVQHPIPKQTCYGAGAWGQDVGDTGKALVDYPNAFAFSGHCHCPLTDERAIWQGAYTSINAGTLTGCVDAVCAGLEWDETRNPNEPVSNLGRGEMGRVAGVHSGTGGLLVDVYDEYVQISRLNLPKGDKALGADWVVPLVLTMSAPRAYSFAERKKKAAAPEFLDGAKIRMSKGIGRAGKNKGKEVLRIEFPIAEGRKGARVLDYHVTIEGKEGKRLVRRVVQPGFNLPSDDPVALLTPCCEIAIELLKDVSPARVAVRPRECFGHAGKPLTAKFTVH